MPAHLLVLMAGLLAIASLPRSILPLRVTLAILGTVILTLAAGHREQVAAAAAGGLLLLVNLAHLLAAFHWGSKARLSPEEKAMADRCFRSLSRHTVRLLLDEGLWVQGKAGEVIVREGAPVSHLFYLSAGDVVVSVQGREIARSGPGHFFGEITILSGAPATARITLASNARFWCVPADGLHRFLAVHPDHRALLEAAFAGDLSLKLQRATARMAAMAAGQD